MSETTIYVMLIGEGTTVWRPVNAHDNGDGSYTICSSEVIPEEEK